jgi:hypothetical protein
MQQTRLASTEQSLINTEQLRYNLSSQRALFAARGQNIGQGTAQRAGQASLKAFGREETARRLNLGYAELTNKGNRALTEINRGYQLEDIANQKRMLGSESRNIKSEARRSRNQTILGSLANVGSMKISDFGSKRKASKGQQTLFSGYEELFR